MSPETLLPLKHHPNAPILGKGADGTVYDLGDNVLKISTFLNYERLDIKKVAKEKVSNLKKLQKLKLDHLVEVFDIGEIQQFSKIQSSNDYLDIFIYSYKMKKLTPTTENQNRILDLISHKDSGKLTVITNKTYEDARSLCIFYDVDFKKVFSFFKSIEASPVRHLDVHPRNIMLAETSSFKLIDLDRITFNS